MMDWISLTRYLLYGPDSDIEDIPEEMVQRMKAGFEFLNGIRVRETVLLREQVEILTQQRDEARRLVAEMAKDWANGVLADGQRENKYPWLDPT